jgi:hypothetical protein
LGRLPSDLENKSPSMPRIKVRSIKDSNNLKTGKWPDSFTIKIITTLFAANAIEATQFSAVFMCIKQNIRAKK